MFSKKTKNYHKTKLESYLTGAIFCLIFLSGFLMWGNAQADFTCTVGTTETTFADCVANSSVIAETGVVTISIPAGTYAVTDANMSSWQATSIVFEGAGKDTTTASGTPSWTVPATIPIEIYGIGFTGIVTLSGSPVNFKIHDNAWTETNNLYIEWTGASGKTPHGVIYNNVLSQVEVVPLGATMPLDNINEIFTTEMPLGVISSDTGTVYIEGNTLLRAGQGYTTDIYNGARVVFRYNTTTTSAANVVIGTHGINFDTSATSKMMRGLHMLEMYKNSLITSSAWPNYWIRLRSGSGVIFDNSVTSSSGTVSQLVNPYMDRSIYAALPVESVGACNGMIEGWDGNETLDASYPEVTGIYGSTHFSGTHNGEDNSATLEDSTAAWNVNSLIKAPGEYPSTGTPGTTVYNVTDGSKCAITANTATVITCTLAGGTDNNWDAGDEYRITDGYPCRDQLGRVHDDPQWDVSPLGAYAQELRPLYVWGNSEDGVLKNNVTPSDGTVPKIAANRDYYTQQGASCVAGGACASGVGSGSAKPTSCTVGTAFWDTDESALYKCTTENNWTKYYEPATCPHPLAGAGTCSATPGAEGYDIVSDDTTAPASPTGLSVN